MSTKNNVGLDVSAINSIVEKLGILLADYHVFYANLRGFHWNIKGDKFFELHELYEEYYNDTAEKIDAVAERIVMLGSVPANTFTQYLKQTTLKEISAESNWNVGVKNVLDTLKSLLEKQREILTMARDAKDVATISLISHGIKEYEKKIWMLSAYLAD